MIKLVNTLCVNYTEDLTLQTVKSQQKLEHYHMIHIYKIYNVEVDVQQSLFKGPTREKKKISTPKSNILFI